MSETKKTKSSLVPPEHCSLAKAFEKLGERWTLLIIRSALYGLTRFEEFQSELGIPRTVLSQRLKRLCEQGIFERRPYKTPGTRQRMAYHLTPLGRELLLPFMGLTQWSDRWHDMAEQPTVCFKSRKTGEPLRIAMVDQNGQAVPDSDILAQLCSHLRAQKQVE